MQRPATIKGLTRKQADRVRFSATRKTECSKGSAARVYTLFSNRTCFLRTPFPHGRAVGPGTSVVSLILSHKKTHGTPQSFWETRVAHSTHSSALSPSERKIPSDARITCIYIRPCENPLDPSTKKNASQSGQPFHYFFLPLFPFACCAIGKRSIR